MFQVLLAYAVSGFIALGYQVVWFRILTDWFGSTNLTFALVVTSFIGGLSAGSVLSARLVALLDSQLRLHDRLRVYGVIELLVAASVTLTLLLNALPAIPRDDFPYEAGQGMWVHGWQYVALHSTVAATCIFLPCVLMGVTFPLLCDAYRNQTNGHRWPAALYASNTAGAVLGVLACQFMLLLTLGHLGTLWLLIATNVLVGGYFVYAGYDARFGVQPDPSPFPSLAASKPPLAQPQRTASTLLVYATLGGFLAGGLEGDLFKRLSFVVELNPGATMSFVSFWAILGIFVASACIYRLPAISASHIKAAMILALVYTQVTWSYVDHIVDFIEANVTPPTIAAAITLEGTRNLIFPETLLQLFCLAGVLVWIPFLLVSLLLPYTCNRIQAKGGHVGLAYGLNAAGFCAGLVAFSLVAPRLNIFYSLKLFPLVFGGAVAWLFLLSEKRQLTRWQPILLPGWLAIVSFTAPTAFDPDFFRADSEPSRAAVRAVKSDGANTTFVATSDGVSRLYFGRLSMSSTNYASQVYMRLMAHFPLLLHPNPKKALLICFGAGNTASAIATHDSITNIDIVDLNERVFETAPEFSDSNRNVIADPRVRLIHDDGRVFLNLTTERYDLITSEPPPPLAAGVYRLYSSEYYATVRKHLTPDGLMTQWLPLHMLSREATAMIVRTFADSFPHALVFTGFGTDFVLVGSNAPINLATLERRFLSADGSKEDLRRIGIDHPVELIARIVRGDGDLVTGFQSGRLIRDHRNDLEQLLPSTGRRPVLSYDPRLVLRTLADQTLKSRNELEGVLLHLGRLRYRVQGFPFESLATVPTKGTPSVTLAGADWLTLAEIYRQSLEASVRGINDQSEMMLQRFISVAAEQPEALLGLAEIRLRQQRFAEAVPLLRSFVGLEKDDAAGQSFLGQALMRSGATGEAVRAFREAIRIAPDRYGPSYRLAWLLATHPDPRQRDGSEAVELAEHAAAIAGTGNLQVQRTLAAAYAASGKFERSIQVVLAATGVADRSNAAIANLLRSDLARYRSRLMLTDESLKTN